MRWGRSKIGTCWTGVNQSEALMNNLFSRFVSDESGVTAIEYGLIAALIAVVIIGAVSTLGTKLSGTFSQVASSL
jgi:pilus assembly protein Flp/PilA